MQDMKLIPPPFPLLTREANLFPVSDTCQHKAKIYFVLRLCLAQQCSQGPYISAFLIMKPIPFSEKSVLSPEIQLNPEVLGAILPHWPQRVINLHVLGQKFNMM